MLGTPGLWFPGMGLVLWKFPGTGLMPGKFPGTGSQTGWANSMLAGFPECWVMKSPRPKCWPLGRMFRERSTETGRQGWTEHQEMM